MSEHSSLKIRLRSLGSEMDSSAHLANEAADAIEALERDLAEANARIGALMGGSVRVVTGSEAHARKPLEP